MLISKNINYISIFFIIFFILSCDSKKQDLPGAEMAIKTIPHCVGYHFIDFPQDYSIASGALAIFLPENSISRDSNIDLLIDRNVSEGEFMRSTSERKADLTAVDQGPVEKLVFSKKLEDGSIIFRVQEIDDAYKSEIHWLLGNMRLIAKIDSYHNQYEKAEDSLLDLKKNISISKENSPGGKFFCIDEIKVFGRYRTEYLSQRFFDKKNPKISFSIEYDTFRPDPPQSLFERVGGSDSLLRKFEVKEFVLRKNEKIIAGMRAQEWGASAMLGKNGDEKAISLVLETMRGVPSPATPKIHLEMKVKGEGAKDEKSILDLWDHVVTTIRAR